MDFWERQWAAARRREREIVTAMTLGDATRMLDAEPFGCACTGPPCCIPLYQRARDLRRGAHIVARLMADATGPLAPGTDRV